MFFFENFVTYECCQLLGSGWLQKIKKTQFFRWATTIFLEHIFCVKNPHGLENDTYSNLEDLLPSENRPIRYMNIQNSPNRLIFVESTHPIVDFRQEGGSLGCCKCHFRVCGDFLHKICALGNFGGSSKKLSFFDFLKPDP